MILVSLKYIKQVGKPYEWTIVGKDDKPVRFGNINLIVGKNAVGKSRTLTVVGDMADLLAQRKNTSKLRASDWECYITLKENDCVYDYYLHVEKGIIADETLSINNVLKLNRKEDKIYSEKDQQYQSFKISDTELTTAIRSEKYPYLDELFEWGNALKKFGFTNQHEKNRLLKSEELEKSKESVEVDPNNVIRLFRKGKALFGDPFVENITDDMRYLDYPIKDVSLVENKHGVGVSVLEEDMSEITIQTDMSQGMFRALAFIIQINYALLSDASVCLLIDDLGEGLDFSRSKLLIEILVRKIDNSNIQIFITTNDRYVMNKIPIEYWSILDRKPQVTVIHNYYNSPEIFDDFKYTGLNNFDFLATDFYLHGFDNEQEA